MRQQRNDLQNRYLRVGYGFNLGEFQLTLNKSTAVIEWYITDTRFETFIITRDRLQHLKISNLADASYTFINWVNEYLKAYNQTKIEPKNSDWKNSLAPRLSRLALILRLDEILKLVPTCSRLVLIPHTVLHLFPLHALPLANGDFLCNIFPDGVSYAPSCQLLQQVQLRQRSIFQSIFAIQNPTGDLSYTDIEVNSILNFFSSHIVLRKNQATKAALLHQMSQLREANSLHFACHGSFNLNFPQDSCLILAESVDKNHLLDFSKCLTLGNLFERNFELDQCRLVVLSACETGLVDFTNMSDEYISLPSGFLYAGSVSVVSSLWTVDDLSAAFLMIKFSQNLSANLSVTLALQQAQNWLRNVTKKQLDQWVTEENLLNPTTKIQLRRRLNELANDAQPFKNPFYWAAFCAIGQ
ncbi:CHAT domain-containing protein [Scytonema sp. UIC 10036]|uniref:CHAT domain-containing protein n=1 Tax=Scytonema sp. UIC 10036 TaxID=2304196 RepID=UPI0012DA8BB0|nr:CHAT domain-containing protein [Scytonema sp. UIC 10036]